MRKEPTFLQPWLFLSKDRARAGWMVCCSSQEACTTEQTHYSRDKRLKDSFTSPSSTRVVNEGGAGLAVLYSSNIATLMCLRPQVHLTASKC